MDGFIKLERSLVDAAFYKDINCKVLFIHLRLIAAYNSYIFGPYELQAGQCVSSIRRLSAETGLSVKEVRNAIDRLIEYGEIEIRERGRGRYGGTIFTLLNGYEREKAEPSEIIKKLEEAKNIDIYFDVTNISEVLHWKRRLKECEKFLKDLLSHVNDEKTRFEAAEDLKEISKQLERLERKEAHFGLKIQKN